MRVSTNIQAMTARRYAGAHSDEVSKETGRLSSGDRIVQAADDPAGLAISSTLNAKLRSNYQAERNTNDSISMVQVAEGTLDVVQNISGRLKELAIQASSDTVNDQDRSLIDLDFKHLKAEVERMTQSTTFNGNHVIKGPDNTYEFQVGINGEKELDRLQYDMGRILDSHGNFGISGINLRSKEGAQSSLTTINNMISNISASRAELGSMSSRMNSAIQNLQVSRENISASNSKIKDADMAHEISEKLSSEIAEKASMAMLKLSAERPQAMLKLVS